MSQLSSHGRRRTGGSDSLFLNVSAVMARAAASKELLEEFERLCSLHPNERTLSKAAVSEVTALLINYQESPAMLHALVRMLLEAKLPVGDILLSLSLSSHHARTAYTALTVELLSSSDARYSSNPDLFLSFFQVFFKPLHFSL